MISFLFKTVGFLAVVAVAGWYFAKFMCKREAAKVGADVDCNDPKKWASFLFGIVIEKIIPPHVFEQFVLRVYDDDCKSCIKAGNCTTCGCKAYAKMMVPWEKDSRSNWSQIIWSKEKYKAWRDQFPATVTVTYSQNHEHETR